MGVRAQECCRVADSVKSDVDALRASQVKSLRASHAMRWEAVLGAWLLQLVDRKPIATYCPAPEPCHCECLIEVAKPEPSSSEWRAAASGLGGLAAGSGLTFWVSRQGAKRTLSRSREAREGEDMASWLNLETPGQILAVWYPDDDVYHERILVWRHSPGFWMTLTPDGDRYIEDLRCAGGDGPSRVKIKGEDFRYWSRVGARAYRFAQPPSDEEFKGHIQDARREMKGDPDFEDGWFPDKVLDMSGNLVAGSSFVPGGPARRRLTGKTPATSGRLGGSLDPAPRVKAFPTLGSSELWVVADPRGDLSVGLKLEPLRTDVFLGGKDGVFLRDGFLG